METVEHNICSRFYRNTVVNTLFDILTLMVTVDYGAISCREAVFQVCSSAFRCIATINFKFCTIRQSRNAQRSRLRVKIRIGITRPIVALFHMNLHNLPFRQILLCKISQNLVQRFIRSCPRCSICIRTCIINIDKDLVI